MTAPAQLKALTGVRFFAALWVVLYHLQPVLPAAGVGWAVPLVADGKQAVPFFFILSGFILSHVYFDDYKVGNHWRFVWLRFARLWPLHAVTLGALVLYSGCLTLARGYAPNPSQDYTRLIEDLSMFRGWYDSEMIWNFPAWSIQAEWFAYIVLFPFCALALRMVNTPALLLVLILSLLALHPYVERSLPGFIGSIICLFIAGAALYRLFLVAPPMEGDYLAYVSVLALPLALYFKAPPHAAFCGIIMGLAYQKGTIAHFLSHPLCVYGGEISFALYMTHFVVNIWTWELWKQMGASGPLSVLSTFCASLLIAILAHEFIEKPANSYLRKKGPQWWGKIIALRDSNPEQRFEN